MNKDVEAFFESNLLPQEGAYGERSLYEIRYAAAALLIACAKSDFEEDPDEEDVIVSILKTRFDIDEELLDQLIVFADAQTGTMSLESFTHLVNKHYSDEHKLVLVEDLWRVAFADGRIDRYEDIFINRVAGLINVSTDAVLQVKESAGDSAST